MVEFGPPQVINSQYRIVELLGKGGIAIVYRAYNDSLERDVAIKFLTASQFGGVQVRERFMREARVVARLSHAHIMAIYDVGQEDTQPYLVLEYIPGTSLSTWLQSHRDKLSLRNVLQIITEVLQVLAFAHARDLIHRDLKPDNILITPDGAVKVADFGLAIAVDEVKLTLENAVIGTVQYMAPELLMSQRATPLYCWRCAALDLIVHMERGFDGQRRILKITEVTGIQGGDIQLRDVFEFVQTDYANNQISGHFTATGLKPTFLRRFEGIGIHLDETLFIPQGI